MGQVSRSQVDPAEELGFDRPRRRKVGVAQVGMVRVPRQLLVDAFLQRDHALAAPAIAVIHDALGEVARGRRRIVRGIDRMAAGELREITAPLGSEHERPEQVMRSPVAGQAGALPDVVEIAPQADTLGVDRCARRRVSPREERCEPADQGRVDP